MEEIWRDIPNHSGYCVSSLGRLRYPSGKISLGCKNPKGYYSVGFRNKGESKLVHRIVAEAFIPNPDSKPFINHIDGNPSNNCIANLEWSTPSENVWHAYNADCMKERSEHRKRQIGSKNSIALLGKHRPDDVKTKISVAFHQLIWVTNGNENHRIKESEVNDYLSRGFWRGRPSHSEETKRKIAIGNRRSKPRHIKEEPI